MARLLVLGTGIVAGLLPFSQSAVAGPPSSVAQYVEMVPTATGAKPVDGTTPSSAPPVSSGSRTEPTAPPTTTSAARPQKRKHREPRHAPELTSPTSVKPATSLGSVTSDWWPVSLLLGAVFAGGIAVRLKQPR